MNREIELRLQAWVDGELTGAEAGEIERLIVADPNARALATELGWTRTAATAGEPERKLAEPREFYWSKIERAILHAESGQAPEAHGLRTWWHRWWRVAAPAGAIAVVLLAASVPVLRGRINANAGLRAEVESPLDDISSFTFRSESEGMTVVWVDSH